MMAVGFGLSSALSTLVSNAKGSGNNTQAQRYVNTGYCVWYNYHRFLHDIKLVPRPGNHCPSF